MASKGMTSGDVLDWLDTEESKRYGEHLARGREEFTAKYPEPLDIFLPPSVPVISSSPPPVEFSQVQEASAAGDNTTVKSILDNWDSNMDSFSTAFVPALENGHREFISDVRWSTNCRLQYHDRPEAAMQADWVLGRHTPLHGAARNGDLDVVDLFVVWGADPTMPDSKGRLAIDEARKQMRMKENGVIDATGDHEGLIEYLTQLSRQADASIIAPPKT
ncbi:MAG: hypothetical protein Q9207_001397 [Kuettlingeria erythrocarpa]